MISETTSTSVQKLVQALKASCTMDISHHDDGECVDSRQENENLTLKYVGVGVGGPDPMPLPLQSVTSSNVGGGTNIMRKTVKVSYRMDLATNPSSRLSTLRT